VAASLVIGVSVLSPAQAAFYSDAEAVREAAAAGSDFVRANVSAHIIETWVPQFKFLGLGLGLMAITLALTVIIGTLRMQAAVLLRFEDQVGGRGQPR
jgi:tetrahydromethanopterin S-methyltransferase subunit C